MTLVPIICVFYPFNSRILKPDYRAEHSKYYKCILSPVAYVTEQARNYVQSEYQTAELPLLRSWQFLTSDRSLLKTHKHIGSV